MRNFILTLILDYCTWLYANTCLMVWQLLTVELLWPTESIGCDGFKTTIANIFADGSTRWDYLIVVFEADRLVRHADEEQQLVGAFCQPQ